MLWRSNSLCRRWDDTQNVKRLSNRAHCETEFTWNVATRENFHAHLIYRHRQTIICSTVRNQQTVNSQKLWHLWRLLNALYWRGALCNFFCFFRSDELTEKVCSSIVWFMFMSFARFSRLSGRLWASSSGRASTFRTRITFTRSRRSKCFFFIWRIDLRYATSSTQFTTRYGMEFHSRGEGGDAFGAVRALTRSYVTETFRTSSEGRHLRRSKPDQTTFLRDASCLFIEFTFLEIAINRANEIK